MRLWRQRSRSRPAGRAVQGLRREDPPLRRRRQGRPAVQLQRPGRRRRRAAAASAAATARPTKCRPPSKRPSRTARRTSSGRSGSRSRGQTIPHRVIGRFGASRVILVPAGPGTGVKAGPGVRDVLQACGIHNILTKMHGSTNPINLVKATIDGLLQLRTREEVGPAAGSDTLMDLTTVHTGMPEAQAQEARRPRHRLRPRQDRLAAAPRASTPAPAPGCPASRSTAARRRCSAASRSAASANGTFAKTFNVVNVGDIDAAFDDGDDGRRSTPCGPRGWRKGRPTASVSSATAR